jgi:hypothetical protein
VACGMDIEHTCLHVIYEILFRSEQLQRVAALENIEVKIVQSSMYKICLFSSQK